MIPTGCNDVDRLLLMFYVAFFNVILCAVSARNVSNSSLPLVISSNVSFCNGFSSIYVPAFHRCCRVCPPGSGVTQPCSVDSNSKCAQCQDGRYSLIYDHEEGCHRCPTCLANSHQVHACISVKPTECECDAGYFYNSTTGFCNKCTSCPHGFGAVVACSAHRNSVCARCPNGTFSDVFSLDAPCQQCMNCTSLQELTKFCTSESNAVCEGEPEDPCSSWLICSIGPVTFSTILYIIILTTMHVMLTKHESNLEKRMSARFKIKKDGKTREQAPLLTNRDFRGPFVTCNSLEKVRKFMNV